MFVEKPLAKAVKLPEGTRLVVLISADFEPIENARIHFHTATLPDYHFFYENEYGGRRGIWRLLETLGRYNIRCTFFICGASLKIYPEACKQIKAAGHEITGHSYHHEHFYKLTEEEEETVFQRMFAALEDFYGERGVGFRSCHPKPPRTLDTVARHGLIYDSSLQDDDLPYVLQQEDGRYLVEIPRWPNADPRMMGMPITWNLASGKYGIPSEVGLYWKAEFDRCYREGAKKLTFFSLCLHDYVCGRPSRAKALDNFLAHTKQFPGVWYATYAEIADLWLKAM